MTVKQTPEVVLLKALENVNNAQFVVVVVKLKNGCFDVAWSQMGANQLRRASTVLRLEAVNALEEKE